MRIVLVAPIPLGALLLGWALGWGISIVVGAVFLLALGFGHLFWWGWDAWRERRRRCEIAPLHNRTSL